MRYAPTFFARAPWAARAAVGRRRLGGRALGEHALVVGREDLHEVRRQRVPLVEHALADLRAGPLDVLGDERAHLDRVALVELLELVAPSPGSRARGTCRPRRGRTPGRRSCRPRSCARSGRARRRARRSCTRSRGRRRPR